MIDQEARIGRCRTAYTPRNRYQMPGGGSTGVRNDQRFLPDVSRGRRGDPGASDWCDLDMEQWDLVKSEPALLKMGGRELGSRDMPLNPDDKEHQENQQQYCDHGHPSLQGAALLHPGRGGGGCGIGWRG